MTRKKPRARTIRRRLPILVVFFLLALAFGTSGCVSLADPETSQSMQDSTPWAISPENTLEQTFTSRRPRLNSLTIWLEPQSKTGEIRIELYQASNPEAPFLIKNIKVASLNPQKGTRLSFFPHGQLQNTKYVLIISTKNALVNIRGRESNQYPYGTLYINQKPVDGDIAFQTTYDYDYKAFLHDIKSAFENWGIFVPLILVLFVPGWLFLQFSKLHQYFSSGEIVALSGSISLATIPLLMQWIAKINITLNRQVVLIIFACLGFLFLLKLLNSKVFSNKNINPLKTRNFQWEGLILLIIFSVTLFTRLVMVRDLVAPAWVDSVHHALATALILKNGGLPTTLEPYLPLEASYYHLGFHSAASVFLWLSNWELPKALLLYGQFLNAAMIYATFLFTKRLFKNSSIALIAALATGVLTPLPAYYASWGRYTQLAGLLVFPGTFALLDVVNRRPTHSSLKDKVLLLISLTIVLSGLFLIHYRVFVFSVVFLLVYLAFHLRKETILNTIKGAGFISVLLILLIIPTLIPFLSQLIIPKVAQWHGGTHQWFSGFSWRFLTAAWGNYSLLIGGFGLLWALFKSWKQAVITLLWIASLFLLANIQAFRIPFPSFINNLSVEISLFMPISAFVGFALVQFYFLVSKVIPKRAKATFLSVAIAAIAVLSFFSIQNLLPLLNPTTFLAREADLESIKWIKQNIPHEETILINPSAWGYGLYMGADGGYWIAPLSGNPTLPPPVIYGLGSPAYVKETNQKINDLIQNANNPHAIYTFLINNHINYLYLGAKGGIFQPNLFEESRDFKTVYNQKGTWLFKVVSP